MKNKIIIFDGAMGTNLQLQDLNATDFGGEIYEGCNEALILSKPDAIRKVHASFLEKGVDVIETDTFGAFSIVLKEYSLEQYAREINIKAAGLAREIADSYATKNHPRFVAGSIGPGTRFPTLGQISFDDLYASYLEQAEGLIEGGVDLIIVETVFDLLQAKAAIKASRQAMRNLGITVPIQAQVTVELTGRMLPGTEINAALNSLEALNPDVIGMNCATGPQEMIEPLRYLTGNSRTPISCLPNAGLPSVVDGKMHYDLSEDDLAKFHVDFVDNLGVSVIGGCCGTTPEHLECVVKAIQDKKRKIINFTHEAAASSLYSTVPFEQESSVLLIGERTNANGSKQFREAMLKGDFETTTQMAKDQIAEGAHMLDVCVDYTGANGVKDMEEVIKRLATVSTVPIVVDSTEPPVIETALKWLGGRAVLNSVNLEDGDGEGTRLDRFLTLAKEYGAAVICTCIDTDGQARTREWKLKAARSIYDLATKKYGLLPEDLIFDALALPLSTGMEEGRKDGIETIEGIRLIKQELKGCHTVLGLSNVSFGLNSAARQALNSVFLHECQEAGLDAAIVHAGKILPLHKIDPVVRQVCEDLIYDRRRDENSEQGAYDPLQELLKLFEGVSSVKTTKEDRSSMPLEQRLELRIVDGDKSGLEDDLNEALQSGLKPLEIVNDILLSGMKTVGELFASGEMQLPFVLSSAETMKTAVKHLEQFMEKSETNAKGSIVLATVAGDVHDIGKNLVDIILTNNGYTVYNLGIKVPVAEILDKLTEYNADAIGMSGLLVKSTLIMRENLEEMNRRNLNDIPVILGGAALTRRYVEHDLRQVFQGRVFYGKDAFEGLRTMNKLIELKDSDVEDPDFGREIKETHTVKRKSEILAEIDESTLPSHSPEVSNDNFIYTPPFLGSRIAKGISIDDISAYLNETSLFRNQWGFRPEKGEIDAEFKDRVRSFLRTEIDFAKSSNILIPQVVWGYYKAQSENNDLILLNEENQEIERFTFPRQKEHPYLSIADFFRSTESNETDYCAFQVVSMGSEVSKKAHELFKADKYNEYVRLHGLGVEMAEALAEYWHFRVRSEWGFASEDGPTLTGLFRQKYRGGRYSFGYPACPRLEDNEKVVKLLGASRIGVQVSEGFQLHPEQTTLAIICHHPKAKYFIA